VPTTASGSVERGDAPAMKHRAHTVPATAATTAADGYTPGACLLCASPGFRVIQAYDAPDDYERAVGVTGSGSAGYARAWVTCSDCGFCYSRYARDPEVLDRIYADAYRDRGAAWRQQSVAETFRQVVALPPEQSESHARIAWVKQEIAVLRATGLLGWRPAPWRLLDVGGATGVFAYLFQDPDWRAAVIDPSAAGAFIEHEHGIPYIAAPFAGDSFTEPFELIAMVFVLEHLRSPHELLAAARRNLHDGGLLYVEVPDAAAFARKPADDDIFNACHLWMFSPASLTRLLDQVGFEVCTLQRLRTLRGHYALRLLAQPRAAGRA